jgi:glycosyl transferase family 25
MFKTLFINLDKDTARRASIEQQLTALNIPFERVPGIDGRITDFGTEYSEALAIEKNGASLTKGELGCAASHKRCHTIALQNEYTLILEDDVLLPKDFKNILEREIKKNTITRKWEYLSFDYPSMGITFIQRWFGSTVLFTPPRSSFMYEKIIFHTIFVYKTLLRCAPCVCRTAARLRIPQVRFWRCRYFL